MVGKRAVQLCVQLDYVAADFAQQLRHEEAGDAVASVDDDPERARHVRGLFQMRVVLSLDLTLLDAPLACAEVAALHDLPDFLYLVARDGMIALADELEAVLVGRVVAAGDIDTAGQAPARDRIVERRRRGHAGVVDRRPGGNETAHERAFQLVAGRAIIPPDNDLRVLVPADVRAEGLSQQLRELCG